MIESQTCEVEEIDIVAESDFVDATASGMSVGVQHEQNFGDVLSTKPFSNLFFR
jgi:hypothetical protein